MCDPAVVATARKRKEHHKQAKDALWRKAHDMTLSAVSRKAAKAEAKKTGALWTLLDMAVNALGLRAEVTGLALALLPAYLKMRSIEPDGGQLRRKWVQFQEDEVQLFSKLDAVRAHICSQSR